MKNFIKYFCGWTDYWTNSSRSCIFYYGNTWSLPTICCFCFKKDSVIRETFLVYFKDFLLAETDGHLPVDVDCIQAFAKLFKVEPAVFVDVSLGDGPFGDQLELLVADVVPHH